LGLGKFVSLYDRIGGNVDTVRNVRKGFSSDKFQKRYEARSDYDEKKSAEYHSDPRYTGRNRRMKDQKLAGNLPDAYTGKLISQNQDIDQDHVISAKEINDDPGRVLAELDGQELANSPCNLVGTDRSINRSKKAKTMSEFKDYLKSTKEKRQKELTDLKSRAEKELTDKERKKIKKLEALESANIELMEQVDTIARKENNKKINKKYYTSGKFYEDLGVSSALEGAKMGFQQAFGLLCVDLTNAIFDEIVDVCQNGFVAGFQTEYTMAALRLRLRRVAVTVWADWRKLVAAFKDGTISGIISNVITTIINTFFTTLKNLVRIIREGTFILFRAAKTILFAPKDKDLTEVWDAALKIIVAGAGTLGAIALDEALAKIFASLPLFAPIAPTLSGIISGIVTGISTSVALFLIDQWDPFGARDLQRRRHIRDKLQAVKNELQCNREMLLREFGLVEPGTA
jgi:hypothetical protein